MERINGSEKIYIGIFDSKNALKHDHDFLELVYVINGSARHFINNSEMTISKGNYFIIDYNTVHSYEQVGTERLEIMNCLFLPEFIDRTLKGCRQFGEVINNYLIHYSFKSVNADPANQIFYDDDKNVYDMIMKIYSEYNGKQAGYIEIMRCALIEIIIYAIRRIQAENRVVYSSVERYIIECVNENYMDKITLGEIAVRLNYSLPYLSKTFKENYGMTFEKFLQRTRIEQSCRLLANTDKKIIDIAECVGYTDLKFFTSVFKKIMNMPPRDYRKLHR